MVCESNNNSWSYGNSKLNFLKSQNFSLPPANDPTFWNRHKRSSDYSWCEEVKSPTEIASTLVFPKTKVLQNRAGSRTPPPLIHKFVAWKLWLGMGGASAQNHSFLQKFPQRAISVLRADFFQFCFEKVIFLKKWPFLNKLQSAHRVARSCARAPMEKKWP